MWEGGRYLNLVARASDDHFFIITKETYACAIDCVKLTHSSMFVSNYYHCIYLPYIPPGPPVGFSPWNSSGCRLSIIHTQKPIKFTKYPN